ncbi:alpha/beta hydrolase [Arthrobacter tecti]
MTSPLDLTVFPATTDTPQPSPAVLVLPGGGYGMTAAHETEPVAQWLAAMGIHAFVLRYRVAPNRHPAPLTDAKAAMIRIREGAHGLPVDINRVGVLGFSAGGHLAASLSTAASCGDPQFDVPAAVPNLSILCYPVISFMDAVHQGSIDNLLGHAPSSDLLRQLSPDLNVTAATPPSFLWHTADDDAVPVEHSLAYMRALVREGVPAELHVFPHGAHGLGLALEESGPDQWTDLCEQWLRRQGWVK